MFKKSPVSIFFRVLGCYLPYLLLILLGIGILFRSYWFLSPLILLFIIVPVLDFLSGKDMANLERSDFSKIQTAFCRLSPFGFIIIYNLFVLAYVISAPSLSAIELAMATIALGAVGAIQITACHELIHKQSRISKNFARFGFMSVANIQFEYYHLLGHHREAATLRDNHTAWSGETFSQYLIRTTKGYLKFIFQFESSRLKRLGHEWLSMENKLLWFFGAPSILLIAISILSGWKGGVLFVGQALIASLSLEAVSYIEHYGLLRHSENGKYQLMGDEHSWNSYHRYSNYLTYMLQRHADHHLNSSKDYFLLRTNHISPELPLGYPLLILIVNVPSLWFRIVSSGKGAGGNGESFNSLSSRTNESL